MIERTHRSLLAAAKLLCVRSARRSNRSNPSSGSAQTFIIKWHTARDLRGQATRDDGKRWCVLNLRARFRNRSDVDVDDDDLMMMMIIVRDRASVKESSRNNWCPTTYVCIPTHDADGSIARVVQLCTIQLRSPMHTTIRWWSNQFARARITRRNDSNTIRELIFVVSCDDAAAPAAMAHDGCGGVLTVLR